MNINRNLFAAMAIPMSLLGITPAMADEGGENDRFSLSAGGYFVTRTNGQIRLDQSVGPVNIGTSIDWQRDLGGDTALVAPRIDGYYRFAQKHRVDFSYYSIDRDGQVVTQRDLNYGDVNFPAGSSINSSFSTGVTKLAYTYSFYRTPEIETGLTLGLHVTQLKATLEAAGLGLAEAASTTAPLPVFGFRLDYALSPKWWVRGKYELFFLDKVDEYRGSLNDFSIAIEHQTFKHVGFGFGYNRNSLDIEVNKNNTHGAFNSLTSGFMFYVVLR